MAEKPLFIQDWPFAFLSGQHKLLHDGEKIELDGGAHPQLCAPFDAQIFFGAKKTKLVPGSFPFDYRGFKYRLYDLPVDNKIHNIAEESFLIDWEQKLWWGEKSCTVIQRNLFKRPAADTHFVEGHGLSKIRNIFLWQLHAIQEIIGSAIIEDEKEQNFESMIEDNFRSVVRREWTTVHSKLLENRDDIPEMSLIVSLLENRRFIEALHSIAGSPRKVLRRIEKMQRADKIQELNAACLRSIARMPGHNIREKAGSRQMLPSVIRQHDFNTLENMVCTWVFAEIKRMSIEYEQNNRRHRENQRVKNVRKRSNKLHQSYAQSSLFEVKTTDLAHPVNPNYTLQLDSRYRHIYLAYKKILQQKKIEDDTWLWLRRTWSQTVRLLFYAWLDKNMESSYLSPVYFHSEASEGQWQDSPFSPGPYKDKGLEKKYSLEVFDSWDICSEALDNEKKLPGKLRLGGKSGCDFYFFSQLKEVSVCLLVWPIFSDLSQGRYEEAVKVCRKALEKQSQDVFSSLNTSKKIYFYGLMVAPDFSGGKSCSLQKSAQKECLFTLWLPEDLHRYQREMDSTFEKLMALFDPSQVNV